MSITAVLKSAFACDLRLTDNTFRMIEMKFVCTTNVDRTTLTLYRITLTFNST